MRTGRGGAGIWGKKKVPGPGRLPMHPLPQGTPPLLWESGSQHKFGLAHATAGGCIHGPGPHRVVGRRPPGAGGAPGAGEAFSPPGWLGLAVLPGPRRAARARPAAAGGAGGPTPPTSEAGGGRLGRARSRGAAARPALARGGEGRHHLQRREGARADRPPTASAQPPADGQALARTSPAGALPRSAAQNAAAPTALTYEPTVTGPDRVLSSGSVARRGTTSGCGSSGRVGEGRNGGLRSAGRRSITSGRRGSGPSPPSRRGGAPRRGGGVPSGTPSSESRTSASSRRSRRVTSAAREYMRPPRREERRTD